MASTADFRNGYTFALKGQLYKIVEFLHVKPGKGGAFVRTKLKNLRTGQVVENTFRAGEKIQDVRIEAKKMQFLYASDGAYHFMETTTYEQMQIDETIIGDREKFLAPNMEVKILFHGSEIIDIELPPFMTAVITKTDPGFRGDTAQSGTKPATLETGAVVHVPLFVKEGEVVKIDTRTGNYVERVK